AFDLVLLLVLAIHLYLYFGLGLQSAQPAFALPWLLKVSALRSLVVLAAYAYLLRRAAPPWRATFLDVTFGLVLLYAGDTIGTSLLMFGYYEPGLLDLGWTLSFLWIAFAAADWNPALEPPATEEQPLVPEWASSRRGAALAIG